jgi:hypothetical protein
MACSSTWLEIPHALLPTLKKSTTLWEVSFLLQNMDFIPPEWLCTSQEKN